MDSRVLIAGLCTIVLAGVVGCGPKDEVEEPQESAAAVAEAAAGTSRSPLESAAATPNAQLVAELAPSSRSVAFGSATFVEDSGSLEISVEVRGAESGAHELAIYRGSRCQDDFSTLSEVFDPDDSADGYAAGALPGLEVGADGVGRLETLSDRLSLGRGASSVTGRALVLTSAATGDRIACGVIGGEAAGLALEAVIDVALDDELLEDLNRRTGEDGNALY